MNHKKRILVNFASGGRELYLFGSQRLCDSATIVGLDADIMICSPDLRQDAVVQVAENTTVYLNKRMPISKEFGECPSHQDAPYAFKSYVIQEARDMGYERVMWGDSSLLFLKNPEPYWKIADETGVVLMDNPGCPESFWTSDDCLEHMGCSFEFAQTFYQLEAFTMIFNFNYPIANELFTEYFKHSRDDICLRGASGSTRPEFRAHRHDQSILSYFAKKLNVLPLNHGAWAYDVPQILEGKWNPTFGKIGIVYPWEWQKHIERNIKEGL
jgi:hypothetical protein